MEIDPRFNVSYFYPPKRKKRSRLWITKLFLPASITEKDKIKKLFLAKNCLDLPHRIETAFLPANLAGRLFNGFYGEVSLVLQSFLNGRVFGDVTGDDPWVLALHGWARTRKDFDKLFALHKEENRQLPGLALDLPGFGLSPPFDGPVGSLDYAKSVAEILSGFDGKFVVVGHSFGGRVALHLPSLLPEKVHSLILTGVPLLVLNKKRPKLGYKAIRTLYDYHLISEKKMETARGKFGSPDYVNASPVMRRVLVNLLREDYRPVMSQITCPVKLLWGSDDQAVPPAVAEKAAMVFPNAELSIKDGVSHLLPLQDPGALYDLCQRAKATGTAD